jgi:hypothetical protein
MHVFGLVMQTFTPAARRAPVALLGKCKACKAPRKVVGQPGLKHTARPDPTMRLRDGSSSTYYQGWCAFDLGGGIIASAVVGSFSDGCFVSCPCGKRFRVRPVRGTHNPDKACSARCQSATGPSCECACGGDNHGASHE